MKTLLVESRENFVKRKLYIKLIKRFWNVINAYKQKLSYGEVLKLYFSGHSKEKKEQHTRITNTQL
jgi:hypothetical protein